jgi:hypothetical protein
VVSAYEEVGGNMTPPEITGNSTYVNTSRPDYYDHSDPTNESYLGPGSGFSLNVSVLRCMDCHGYGISLTDDMKEVEHNTKFGYALNIVVYGGNVTINDTQLMELNVSVTNARYSGVYSSVVVDSINSANDSVLSYFSGPSPSSLSLNPGETKNFTYIFKGNGSGVTTVNATVRNDTNYYTNTDDSDNITVLTFTYTPPQWRNQGQNVSVGLNYSHIPLNGTILLYAEGFSATALDWALLETNESGTWENKSAYGSPLDMDNALNTWNWSNFTWQNTSIGVGTTVLWRIWYNDTENGWNVTDTRNFSISSLYDSEDPNPPTDPGDGGTWNVNQDVRLNGSGWRSSQSIRINITDPTGSTVHDVLHSADASGNFQEEFADLGTDYPDGTYKVYVSTDGGATWIQYDSFTVVALPEFPFGTVLALLAAAAIYGKMRNNA